MPKSCSLRFAPASIESDGKAPDQPGVHPFPSNVSRSQVLCFASAVTTTGSSLARSPSPPFVLSPSKDERSLPALSCVALGGVPLDRVIRRAIQRAAHRPSRIAASSASAGPHLLPPATAPARSRTQRGLSARMHSGGGYPRLDGGPGDDGDATVPSGAARRRLSAAADRACPPPATGGVSCPRGSRRHGDGTGAREATRCGAPPCAAPI